MTKGNGVNFELDELLHPAQAFNHPSEVVNDPDLTLNEKRAILASWASDACAIEAAPALRRGSQGSCPLRRHHGRVAGARQTSERRPLSKSVRSALATSRRATTTTTKAGSLQ